MLYTCMRILFFIVSTNIVLASYPLFYIIYSMALGKWNGMIGMDWLLMNMSYTHSSLSQHATFIHRICMIAYSNAKDIIDFTTQRWLSF